MKEEEDQLMNEELGIVPKRIDNDWKSKLDKGEYERIIARGQDLDGTEKPGLGYSGILTRRHQAVEQKQEEGSDDSEELEPVALYVLNEKKKNKNQNINIKKGRK